METLLLTLLLCASVSAHCKTSITTASGTKAPARICSGDLIFEDQFDTFDLQTWNHEKTMAGGGNWEFEMYHNNRSNSYVRDGVLYIKPTLTADRYGERFLSSGTLKMYGGAPADQCTDASYWGCERKGTTVNILNPITSARIRTVDSFNFCYGRVEIRAKHPAGDWMWPAIWMLPRYNEYGSWPASGEIDISETRGNRNLVQDGLQLGTELSSSTLHFGPFYHLNGYQHAHFENRTEPGQGFDQEFHRFQLEWTADYLQFGIDDHEIGRVTAPDGGFWEVGNFNSSVGAIDNPWRYGTKIAPFDKQFYFLLNVAVGGTNNFFPDQAVNPGGKPWSNNSPRALTDFWNGRHQWLPTWDRDGENSTLQVDYIRVWAI